MDEAKYDVFFEVEDRHWWFTARRQILLALLAKYGPEKRPFRLLDVGCGTGMLATAFARAGAEVTALDPSQKALAYVKRRDCSIETVEGEFPDRIGSLRGPFDVVGLLDALEHMDDDEKGLTAARDLLAPGGMLLVTVPALPSLWSAHDTANHHRRRYVKADLRRKLAEAGFEIRFLSYFNSLLFPFAWAVRKLRRGGTGLEDHAVQAAWINGPLYAAFLAEKPFLAAGLRFPLGLSLVAIASK